MKVTPDIVRYEFIGSHGSVAKSVNTDYLGVRGQVVGETKNTFTFQNHGKSMSVIKESAIFNFKFSDGTIVEIDGKLLVGRSEDRLKKSIKRLW